MIAVGSLLACFCAPSHFMLHPPLPQVMSRWLLLYASVHHLWLPLCIPPSSSFFAPLKAGLHGSWRGAQAAKGQRDGNTIQRSISSSYSRASLTSTSCDCGLKRKAKCTGSIPPPTDSKRRNRPKVLSNVAGLNSVSGWSSTARLPSCVQ